MYENCNNEAIVKIVNESKKILERTHCCNGIEFRWENGNLSMFLNGQRVKEAAVGYAPLDEIDFYSFKNKASEYKSIKDKNGNPVYFKPNGYFESVHMPPFSKMFSLLTIMLSRIPTPMEFYKFYGLAVFQPVGETEYGKLIYFKPWADARKPERRNVILPPRDNIYDKSLMIRIMKGYCSFVREVFGHLDLVEEAKKRNIPIVFFRSTKKDITEDADIVAKYKGNLYYISFYDNTVRGMAKRRSKEDAREFGFRKESAYSHIDVPTNFSFANNGEKLNTYTTKKGIELYNYETINKIINQILTEQNGNILLN